MTDPREQAREIVDRCRHVGYESRGEWWSYGGACPECIAAALVEAQRGAGATDTRCIDTDCSCPCHAPTGAESDEARR